MREASTAPINLSGPAGLARGLSVLGSAVPGHPLPVRSLPPRALDEALATEYVAGVLDADEIREAEARIQRDPGFAALVIKWQALMGAGDQDLATTSAPIPPATAASDKARPARQGGRVAAVAGWLSGALLASLLVLVAIALFAPPRSRLLATLATADQRLAYQVLDFGTTLQVTRLAGQPAARGMVHELWLFPPDGTPVALGRLGTEPLVIDRPATGSGSSLGISLEDEGGTDTQIPTGPMILKSGLLD